jgi:hypothetical protein
LLPFSCRRRLVTASNGAPSFFDTSFTSTQLVAAVPRRWSVAEAFVLSGSSPGHLAGGPGLPPDQVLRGLLGRHGSGGLRAFPGCAASVFG